MSKVSTNTAIRLTLVVLVIVAAMVLAERRWQWTKILVGPDRSDTREVGGDLGGVAAATGTVCLVIEFDEEKQKRFDEIPWTDGMTALEAMRWARERGKADRKSGFDFKYRDSGRMAFLTEIDGVKNQGGGLRGKNWRFWLNDKLATQGFGVLTLKKSDVVRWEFGSR